MFAFFMSDEIGYVNYERVFREYVDVVFGMIASVRRLCYLLSFHKWHFGKECNSSPNIALCC
jgi:hypothetical protein